MPPLSLHFAVWDDNMELLAHLLETGDAHLEEEDKQGNTPLLLAYRLRRHEAAKMLIAAGSFTKPRAGQHKFESVQVAGLTADPKLVRTAVLAYLKETDAAFERRMPKLQASLEAMPDFTLRMSWEFSSWLPLVSRLLPSDTWVIYKRGSSIRLDSTLLQMSGLSWERGSQTVLIWGRDMPKPGASFVLDNEDKAVADTRLALLHPSDISQQDWVRKLISKPHKVTDFWSRDAVIVPMLKQSLFGSFSSALSRAVRGDDTPRGRISETTSGAAASPKSPSVAAAATAADASDDAGDASPAAVDARTVREDVGVWRNCSVYELKNLCVRDVTHPAPQNELPLSAWWQPELSVAATASDVAAVEAAAAGKGGAPASEEAATPDAKMGMLNAALTAIMEGRIKELQAGTLPAVGSDSAKAPPPPAACVTHSFEAYFGVPRTNPSDDSEWSLPPLDKRSHYVHTDGLLHRPTASVAEHRTSALTIDEKVLDLKMWFSERFPITVRAHLCWRGGGGVASFTCSRIELVARPPSNRPASAACTRPPAARAIPARRRAHGPNEQPRS